MDDFADVKAVADRLKAVADKSTRTVDLAARVAVLYEIDDVLEELKRLLPRERHEKMPPAIFPSVKEAYDAACEEGAKTLLRAWQERFPLDLARLAPLQASENDAKNKSGKS